jgi:proteasome lid subunit RPN8/RPN11
MPATICRHRFALDLFRRDGTMLARCPAAPDWEPAVEWARYEGLRRGLLTTGVAPRIDPSWHPNEGEPYVVGFGVHLETPGERAVQSHFPITYFESAAREASAELVHQGYLEEGEQFLYTATAFASEVPAAADVGSRIRADEASPPVPLREGRLEEVMALASPVDDVGRGVPPVLLPSEILDEACTVAHEAAPDEAGGILIGHLYRDLEAESIFAVITAQVRATRVHADTTSLTFTADTWADVRAAIALRERQEMMLGWFHSHPVRDWCGEDEGDRESRESLAAIFSHRDRAVHRTVFSQPWAVALVISEIADGDQRPAMWGWRGGRLERRGFHLIRESEGRK